MECEEFLKSGYDTVYLVRCALNGGVPEKEKVKKMDLKTVFLQAKRHSLLGITYFAISSYTQLYGSEGLDEELLRKWKIGYVKILKRLVAFDIEREKLCSFFESENMNYALLKGVIISTLYPNLGMRQMADNDILTSPANAKKIKRFMTENGYSVHSYGKSTHDVYIGKGLTFEIHKTLANVNSRDKKIKRYYDGVLDRMISGEGRKKLFSDEDFYVYMTYHAYKHYSNAGFGIRSLVDTFVFIKEKGDGLNFEHIDRELSYLGLLDFERQSKSLAFSLFSQNCNLSESLSEKERAAFECYVISGSFGTFDNAVKKSVEAVSKNRKSSFSVIKYLFRRIFPPMDYYKNNYPKTYKLIITIPFFWAYRLTCTALFKRKRVKAEINVLKNQVHADFRFGFKKGEKINAKKRDKRRKGN